MNIKAEDCLPEDTMLIKGNNTGHNLLKPGGEMILEYQIKFTSRGNHSFNQVKLKLSDVWNLYTLHIQKEHRTEVVLHSDPQEIQKAKRVSQREHVEILTPSLIGTETIHEMEGIRDYMPGDRLKDIEWKATSRLQKLMTKLWEKKEIITTILLLDCSQSMRRTTQEKSKIEHASNLAVQLTNILQSIRHPVGMIAFDEYKIIKNTQPSYDYKPVFENLSDLPNQIKTSDYSISNHTDIQKVKTDKPMEHQRFLSTVFPFLAQGKRTIKHSLQASGVYEALRYLMMDNKTKHLVIISDLETNVQSLYRAITMAHAHKYNIWLLTPFSAFYHMDKTQLTSDQLEKIYTAYAHRQTILAKIRKMNIDIVELAPNMESVKIMEKIRRGGH
ncbi:MAG: DUF58 domain-containing protein [Petrotogales bacterium]